jgi:hypothetical protein
MKNTKTFEATGSPAPTFEVKKDFFDFMEKHGYEHTSLTKDTDLLVTDSLDSTSSKMAKAMKNGIEIKTYEQVLDELS